MGTILIIINGISLPYRVIEYAVVKAKENSSEIFALFLKGKHEPSKGYGYPSDLPTTETWTSDKEAVSDDEKIIEGNVLLVKKLVEDEKISFRSVLKTNASLKEVIETSESADLIVVDEKFDKPPLLGESKFSLKDLRKKVSIPVYTV